MTTNLELTQALYDLLTAIEQIHEPNVGDERDGVPSYWVSGNVGQDVMDAARATLGGGKR